MKQILITIFLWLITIFLTLVWVWVIIYSGMSIDDKFLINAILVLVIGYFASIAAASYGDIKKKRKNIS